MMNSITRVDSCSNLVSNVCFEKINANEISPKIDNFKDICASEVEETKQLSDHLHDDKNGNAADENNEFLMMVHCKSHKSNETFDKRLLKSGTSNEYSLGVDHKLDQSSVHNTDVKLQDNSSAVDGCCKKICSKFYNSESENVIDNYEIAAWRFSLTGPKGKIENENGSSVDLESIKNDETDSSKITLETGNSYHIIDLGNKNCDNVSVRNSTPVTVTNDESEVGNNIDLVITNNSYVHNSKQASTLKEQDDQTKTGSSRCMSLGDSVRNDAVNFHLPIDNEIIEAASLDTQISEDDCKQKDKKCMQTIKTYELGSLEDISEKHDPCSSSFCPDNTSIFDDNSNAETNSQVYFEIHQNCILNGSERLKRMKNENHRSKKQSCSDEAYCASRNRYGYDLDNEPIHMTLEEVKTSLKQLYENNTSKSSMKSSHSSPSNRVKDDVMDEKPARAQAKRGPFHICLRHKKNRDGTDCEHDKKIQHRKSFPYTIKQTFCSWFGKKSNSPKRARTRGHSKSHEELSFSDIVSSNLLSTPSRSIPSLSPFVNRALPPVPSSPGSEINQQLPDECDQERSESPTTPDPQTVDFTASIHKVKDYGWYWGPISGETAERILAGEPDGSFIVRDSSDEHYIFSLTFKLNGLVRHVRIEHNQGKFSFGTFTNFKSHTIVGFIENAVEHSRSGRYLFFLHRRPILGPMRVQLLHPVSRFKQVQSLQHMCRFVVLKVVRRDLIYKLPLPKRLKDYLNTPQYYTENMDLITHDDLTSHVLSATTPEQNLLHGELTNPSYR